MSKMKTKRGPMDTTATYSAELREWYFTTGVLEWMYREGLGINLWVRLMEGESKDFQPSIYAKTLDHAIMWAWGFQAGLESPVKK